jgi:uncharacterized repeat protein (TIGR03803 family)
LTLDGSGNLYGTTSLGGANDNGEVFQLTKAGGGWTELVLHNFCSTSGCADGSGPEGGVTLGKRGTLYGTTESGGSSRDSGVLFKLTLGSGEPTETVLYTFGTNAARLPLAPVNLDAAGNLYTTYSRGGADDDGGVLALISGAVHLVPFGSAVNGAFPITGLLIDSQHKLAYGVTQYGGTGGGGSGKDGTIYKVNQSGKETVLYNFCAQSGCSDGYYPVGDCLRRPAHFSARRLKVDRVEMELCLSSHPSLAAIGIQVGRRLRAALVWSVNSRTEQITTKPESVAYGEEHTSSIAQFERTAMMFAMRNVLILLLVCAASYTGAGAQVFSDIVNFDGTNGSFPGVMALVQGQNGALYGTTSSGGAFSSGTVFKLDRRGTLTTLYSFCKQTSCEDGVKPGAGLVLATDGNFYGTTESGGFRNRCGNGCGTVFKITPAGTFTPIHSFCYPSCGEEQGATPYAGLIQAADGVFYGTTLRGGDSSCTESGLGCGTIFKVTRSGDFTNLHTFVGNDGSNPNGGLIQATNGNFYGATNTGGTYGMGTLFEISSAGVFTSLHIFNGTDGDGPTSLLQADDGNLYGTTQYQTANGLGTIFRITPDGEFTSLYTFDGDDGEDPVGPLIQATDGNLYGVTEFGGLNSCSTGDCGTLYRFTLAGTLTTMYDFTSKRGWNPSGTLLQATNGTFFGTANLGGDPTCQCGSIYSFSIGLGPFVDLVQSSGKVGQTGGILGQGFTGTTAVTLNGTPASFTVASDTLIKATVPAGATTGYVTVATPTGTLTSNVPFHVIP